MFFYRNLLNSFLMLLFSKVDGEEGGSEGDTPPVEETKTYSAEEYEKAEKESNNNKLALKQFREKTKKELEELENFRAEKLKTDEAEAKKKGKYLDLLEEKDKSISDLTEKAGKWDKYITEKEEALTSKVADLTSKLDTDVLEKNKFILDDLNLEKQAKFLENLTAAPKDFGKTPETKGEKKKDESTDDLKISEYEAKVKKGVKVSPTEKSDYLNLLRKI